jgi:hypothetical protein
MKGRWESSINVWIPFMYFQKWNCYFQNRITVQCSVSEFLHSYISERFTYFQDQYAYSAAGKYVDRFWEYINLSQTHECGNLDWGRAILEKEYINRTFVAVGTNSGGPLVNTYSELLPGITYSLDWYTIHTLCFRLTGWGRWRTYSPTSARPWTPSRRSISSFPPSTSPKQHT